jgi:CMP-N,N'-diacetyllegionaminic acid synthase
MRAIAIIPARGGSKGVRRKNLLPVCGKPLLVWTIEQAKRARGIESVWVTSDNEEILVTGERYGAYPINRPPEISGDAASSESAWLHALQFVETTTGAVDTVVGMQATSPVREPSDVDLALDMFVADGLDSLLTCCEIQDFFIWRFQPDGVPASVNYDYRARLPRQRIDTRYLENGSFYIFKPETLRKYQNRLGGKIGIFVMEKHKMFQVDQPDDVRLCEGIMRGFGIAST